MAGKKVLIRTLEAMAGTAISLPAGAEYEEEEDIAAIRVEAGLAEYVDPPVQRRSVKRAGGEEETASVKADEKRG